MKNADKPAYPCLMQKTGEDSYRAAKPSDPKEYNYPTEGLTKREHLAAMAMQGLLSNSGHNQYFNGNSTASVEVLVAEISVELADALLAELEK